MQDRLGFTALGIACQKGHVQIANLLIERGAAIDYKNKVSLRIISTGERCKADDPLPTISCLIFIPPRVGHRKQSIPVWPFAMT